ncbi:thioredoxin domain-containing protein [soil metagenome]
MKNSGTANRLLNEPSPYLQQHAYNPVDWYPWGPEALSRAKKEDKPIIVSIGYSACHWCHVMERECFEKEDIARIMNANFINIKVDREERPDVDQIYMDAIQAMGVQGGWPLNVFLTPDQKPFYGGTYFPPQNWTQLLQNVAHAYKNNRGELEESAEGFTESLSLSEVKKYRLEASQEEYNKKELDGMFQKLAAKFDRVKGGMDKAPKFPMPAIWKYLLNYYSISLNEDALKQLKLTLHQMAYGGIYDQVGGGFARYSVDDHWFAPHFEKMLYDNAQLVSMYSRLYNLTQEEQLKEVVYETISFVERELTYKEGGFFSALDADSEGEEGKYYVWSEREFTEVLAEDADLMRKYFNVVPHGNWEHGQNILFKKSSDGEFAAENDLDLKDLQAQVKRSKSKLQKARSSRVRPGLDDKILTGWNGLMLQGLCDAYAVFGEPTFLELAVKNASFINKRLRDGHRLMRNYKNGKASINGYLEDYAFVIQAFISLYQVTFDESWLNSAAELSAYTLKNFYDEEEFLFYYTDINSEKLIARKKEIFDNVIPSSNSVMAGNLLSLATLLEDQDSFEIAEKMISKVQKLIKAEPSYLANWACQYARLTIPTAEIAIVGTQAELFRREIENYFFPHKIIAGTPSTSNLPLLASRDAIGGKTTVYVCFNKTCKLPVHSVEEALLQLTNQN